MRKFLLRMGFLFLIIYAIYTFISQQESFNSYAAGQEYYEEKIIQEKEHKETLLKLKENINSPQYIEQIAREKLDMYLPNERVYLEN